MHKFNIHTLLKTDNNKTKCVYTVSIDVSEVESIFLK